MADARLRHNALANIGGKAISALSTIFFVPWYLKLLGAEAYGLVSIAAIIQLVIFVADFGLSGSLTREIARALGRGGEEARLGDLFRTFEVLFSVGGLIIVLLIASSSWLLATHWLRAEHLAVSTMIEAICLMGLVTGFQFVSLVYQGGLLGYQRQVALNVVLVATALLRTVGAVLVLLYVERTIIAFFLWQIIVALLQALSARWLLQRALPAGTSQRFDLGLLRPLFRFSLGMAGISLTGLVLMNMDKVILSRMLPLKELGYYTLAAMPATVPMLLGTAIQAAIYPRIIQLVAQKDEAGLLALYMTASRVIAIPVWCIGALFLFFSHELMLIWTRSPELADHTYAIVRLVTLGSVLAAIMLMPFALQLAYGWTRLSLYFNLGSILTIAPVTILLVRSWGPLGAASVWLMVYVVQLLFMVPVVHRRLLRGHIWSWYLNSVILPMVIALSFAGLGRLLVPSTLAALPQLSIIGGIGIAAMLAMAAAANQHGRGHRT